MADYDTRPLTMYHSSEWQLALDGHTPDPGPSSNRSGRASISNNSLNSRRRSSAAAGPPAGPPPSQPIPSLPPLSEDPPYSSHAPDDDYVYDSQPQADDDYNIPGSNTSPIFSNPFQRPTASSQLAAVAQFSQTRLAAASPRSNLSDSPPRSLLHRNEPPPRPPPGPPQSSREIIPDRLLLSPPDQGSPAQNRPSSRRTLTRALELAREAVRLDSTNDDPHGAIRAYGESVALLNEVMERVMRGEDTSEHRRRNGRRRSIVAQEDEVRRLRTIHDAYADRMNILSLIYSIPTEEQRPDSRLRTDSQSTSSTNSRTAQPFDNTTIDEEYRNPQGTREFEELMAAGLGISNRSSPPDAYNGSEGVRTRQGSSNTRMRSSSNLPPQAPAPSTVLPSAPFVDEHNDNTLRGPPSPSRFSAGTRSRGASVSRSSIMSRPNVARDEGSTLSSRGQHLNENEVRRTNTDGNSYNTDPNSPPLPALPSPSPSDTSDHGLSVTPRVSTTLDMVQIFDVDQGTSIGNRPRGGTTMSDNTDTRNLLPLINESTMMGTISQRRNKPVPASTIFESNADASDGLPKRLTGSSLPSATISSLGVGRSRASSHPVRPSNYSVTGLPLESGSRLPLPSIVNSSANQPRKASSGFRQSPQPPRASQQSPYPPSSYPGPIITLIPPPPVLPGQLPTTPTSPLPALPPNDTLRKPYHLMNLLSHTMSSKSGGYITRRLHVPYEVWSQGGAKLTNLPDKIRVVEVLCEAMNELQNASVEFCGPMGAASGMGLGLGSVTRRDGEIWSSKLDELLVVCDSVVSNFGKKLSVGEGFVVKKNSVVGSWGGKLSRQLNKLTNEKNLDSPTLYVQGLQKLFQLAQLLDDHTMALNAQPLAPVYSALAADLRHPVELKLKRLSEFFASVVLTFVIRDLSQLLDKYAKKGEKWLAE